MTPRPIRRLLLLLTIGMLPIVSMAQEEGRTQKEQEKIQAKQKKEKKKVQAAYEKEKRKRHLELQDKETRKRVKKNTRRADRNGSNTHRDPWIKRVFRKQ